MDWPVQVGSGSRPFEAWCTLLCMTLLRDNRVCACLESSRGAARPCNMLAITTFRFHVRQPK